MWTRTKKMVLVFLEVKGVIYTNYFPKFETINAEYVKKALARFPKVFQREEANHVIPGLLPALG
jgi:hypothetical protein